MWKENTVADLAGVLVSSTPLLFILVLKTKLWKSQKVFLSSAFSFNRVFWSFCYSLWLKWMENTKKKDVIRLCPIHICKEDSSVPWKDNESIVLLMLRLLNSYEKEHDNLFVTFFVWKKKPKQKPTHHWKVQFKIGWQFWKNYVKSPLLQYGHWSVISIELFLMGESL